jgi:hypothetical protein
MTRSKEPRKPPPAKRPRPSQPKHSAGTAASKAARQARLAEEMRSNLLKRKARQRAQRDRGKPE